jgi:alpha,alpha-trehalase
MFTQDLFFIESLGALYTDVQMGKVFPDSKYFVDCVPKTEPAAILYAYNHEKKLPGFDLSAFVSKHFIYPAAVDTGYTSGNKPLQQHLQNVWDVLTRPPSDKSAGTLIPLPHPYIVPGGRFREVYYWDSYFTMLGLQMSGRVDIIQHMIDNFAYLLNRIGFIPNANRTYYLGRSQPPFFTLMVELLAEEKGPSILLAYRPQIEKEYAFWMADAEKLTPTNNAQRRVVLLPDGTVLNRYWDDYDTPRPEAYIEDRALADSAGGNSCQVYRHLRAAAESGWDFSSRWFSNPHDMATIQTTHLVPVDLNCLLLRTEEVLLLVYSHLNDADLVNAFTHKIEQRKKAIQQYCYNEVMGYYVDFNFVKETQNTQPVLAMVYPLFFKIATAAQAASVAMALEACLLAPGGLLTTACLTGQQWDAPNGWAPLQWMAFTGLKQYGHHALADEVRKRWMAVNENVYTGTGKMMEKYNVANTSTKAGGGEYPNQDGFGWTNGVYLGLQQAK